MDKIPLLLFPGLSCTEQLFQFQIDGLSDEFHTIVPQWVEPRRNESLEQFALRWGEYVWNYYFSDSASPENKLNQSDGIYLGGLSFGGMVAPIIGEFLESKGVHINGCFGISTVRSSKELPNKSLFFWKMMDYLPRISWLAPKVYCKLSLAYYSRQMSYARRQIYQQLIKTPCRRSAFVLRMISHWVSDKKDYDFPIYQIHGSSDTFLPFYKTKPNELIPYAGHCLTLTHSRFVNEYIRKCTLGVSH